MATPASMVVIHDGGPQESVDLLADACAARGVAFESVDASALDPRRPPCAPGSLLYTAGTSRAAQLAEIQLYGPGVATFYLDAEYGPLRDIVAQDAVLARAGVPMPRSVLLLNAADRRRLRALVDWLGGLPVVLKMDGGEGGVGVMRLDTWPSLFSVADHLCAGGTPRLMAYVPDGLHWRLVVVGDRVVAAYPNPTDPDDFRSAPAASTADYIDAPDPEWAALAVEATAALGYAFAGVDLLVHPSGRVYVLEVNFPCYYPHAQLEAGLDVAGPMVDWLLARARSAA